MSLHPAFMQASFSLYVHSIKKIKVSAPVWFVGYLHRTFHFLSLCHQWNTTGSGRWIGRRDIGWESGGSRATTASKHPPPHLQPECVPIALCWLSGLAPTCPGVLSWGCVQERRHRQLGVGWREDEQKSRSEAMEESCPRLFWLILLYACDITVNVAMVTALRVERIQI